MAYGILLNHSINYCNHSVEIAFKSKSKWIQISISALNRCLLNAFLFERSRSRDTRWTLLKKSNLNTDRHDLAYSCFELGVTISFKLSVNTRFKWPWLFAELSLKVYRCTSRSYYWYDLKKPQWTLHLTAKIELRDKCKFVYL